MIPAIFIDKDGTLVEDVPFNVDVSRIRLMPGVSEGLRLLSTLSFPIFIVTNQPGLAHGRFTEQGLRRVRAKISEIFDSHGCRLSGFYFCPHDPNGTVAALSKKCGCRKPLPGLLLRAQRERGIDLFDSWMIGDILNDVEAAHRAHCRAVLVDNGNETEWRRSKLREPDMTVARFDEAIKSILTRRALTDHGNVV